MGSRQKPRRRYQPAVQRFESKESTSGLAASLAAGLHPVVHASSLQTRDYAFTKTIDTSGYGQVGDVYTMSAGKFVQVALTSSGGKKVNWKVYNADGHHLLGQISEEAGDRKTIWTNTTGRTIKVVFEADPVAVVNVRVTGKFIFGYY